MPGAARSDGHRLSTGELAEKRLSRFAVAAEAQRGASLGAKRYRRNRSHEGERYDRLRQKVKGLLVEEPPYRDPHAAFFKAPKDFLSKSGVGRTRSGA